MADKTLTITVSVKTDAQRVAFNEQMRFAAHSGVSVVVYVMDTNPTIKYAFAGAWERADRVRITGLAFEAFETATEE